MPHCYRCNLDKPKDAFQSDHSRITKLMSVCRDCNREQKKARRRKAKFRKFCVTFGITP